MSGTENTRQGPDQGTPAAAWACQTGLVAIEPVLLGVGGARYIVSLQPQSPLHSPHTHALCEYKQKT